MKQTFIQFLAEARRNPEQNPKVSINQQIDDYAGSDPKHAYISFTEIDKLGINPKSGYDTPLGIYAYPVDYVQEETEDGRWMRALPFAGKSEFATLFRSNGNIVELDTMSPAEAREYYKKLADIWVKHSGKDWKTSVDQVEAVVNEASKMALFPDYVGGRFWYVTMEIAGLLTLKLRKENKISISIWNKLFRELGIDGCVDRGVGIIHSNEPNQAVFFSINAIADQKRVYNKWSPEAVEAGEQKGSEKIDRMQQFADKIKGMSVDQIATAFANGELTYNDINYLKNPAARLAVLKRNPSIIHRIAKPTINEQITAIHYDAENINVLAKLGKLSNGAVVSALQQSATDDEQRNEIVALVRNVVSSTKFTPSLDLYKLLLDVDFNGLQKISLYRDIPYEIVKLANTKMRGLTRPSWLVVAAQKYNLK